MGISAKKVSTRHLQPSAGMPGKDDPHDAIEREFLGLWLGLGRLRDAVRSHCGCHYAGLAGKPAVGRKARRKAA